MTALVGPSGRSPYCLYWPLVYVMFVLVHRNMQAILLRNMNITHTLCVSVTLVYLILNN